MDSLIIVAPIMLIKTAYSLSTKSYAAEKL